MHPRAVRFTKSTFTWLLVIIPLGWGVIRSVQKSLPLFEVSAPAQVPAGSPK
jgi:hypothetical protein